MDNKVKFKRKLTGKVLSDKCDKTLVVNVVRKYKHRMYDKYVHQSKKYHAHDEKNEARIGDTVTIIESRPYSKTKKWSLQSIKSTNRR